MEAPAGIFSPSCLRDTESLLKTLKLTFVPSLVLLTLKDGHVGEIFLQNSGYLCTLPEFLFYHSVIIFFYMWLLLNIKLFIVVNLSDEIYLA